MKRPQYSLWWLLGFTTFTAVGSLALVNASSTWAMLLHSVMLGLLLVAIPRAVYRNGPVRAFWLGFAVWGWIYLALMFGSSLKMELSDDFIYDSQLVTTHLLHLGYDHVLPKFRTPPQGDGMSLGMGGFAYPPLPASGYPDYSSFLRVGEPLWTFVLAMIGGLTAQYLYRTRASPAAV